MGGITTECGGKAAKKWRDIAGELNGSLISGVLNSGVTIARNTVTPDTGIWVSAATTYGIYIGAKSLYQVDAGQTSCANASAVSDVGGY